MQGYTDIHSHILFGVDDGACDIDMSIRMLRIAAQNEITQIILTPHYKPMHHNISRQKMLLCLEKLQNEVQKNSLNIKLYMGNELYYCSEALELLENARTCTMAESSYVLLEFGPMDEFDYIRNAIYQLIAGGYLPILAHAERYRNVCAKVEHVEDLIEMGCYIQLNADSIMGRSGYQAKHLTRHLLKQKLVHFVATDAHNDKARGPFLQECAEYIRKKLGEDYMRQLLCDNPAHMIANEYI